MINDCRQDEQQGLILLLLFDRDQMPIFPGRHRFNVLSHETGALKTLVIQPRPFPPTAKRPPEVKNFVTRSVARYLDVERCSACTDTDSQL